MPLLGRVPIIYACLLLLMAGALQGTGNPQGTRVEVVATIYPLGEFARRVGGEQVRTRVLVPPGGEAHHWEPTPKDLTSFGNSQLFIYNGAGFEPWVSRVLKAGAFKGARVVNATEGLPLIKAGKGTDSHIWLDPILAQHQVGLIRDGLMAVAPGQRDYFSAQATRLIAELKALDQKFRTRLGRCAKREVITAHAAFGYLARRYGFEAHAIAGLQPEAEPSPRQMARLVELARGKGIRYVLFESAVSPKLAQALAREVGAQTLFLHPLESLPPDEARRGGDYFSLMEQNLKTLEIAMECRR